MMVMMVLVVMVMTVRQLRSDTVPSLLWLMCVDANAADIAKQIANSLSL